MRPLLLLIFFSAFALQLRAQEKDLFLELGGSGGLGSINYEYWMKIEHYDPLHADYEPPKLRYTIRAGFSTTPIDRNNGWVLVFPMMYNLIYGKESSPHRVEIGAGFAPSITTHGAWFIKSPLQLSYRFMPISKSYFIRVSYTPIVAWLVDFQVQQWFGVSFGYRLNTKTDS